MLRAFCLASVSLERKNLFPDLTGGDRLIRDVGLQGGLTSIVRFGCRGRFPCETTVEEKRLSIVRPTAALPYSERELNPHQTFRFIGF